MGCTASVPLTLVEAEAFEVVRAQPPHATGQVFERLSVGVQPAAALSLLDLPEVPDPEDDPAISGRGFARLSSASTASTSRRCNLLSGDLMGALDDSARMGFALKAGGGVPRVSDGAVDTDGLVGGLPIRMSWQPCKQQRLVLQEQRSKLEEQDRRANKRRSRERSERPDGGAVEVAAAAKAEAEERQERKGSSTSDATRHSDQDAPPTPPAQHEQPITPRTQQQYSSELSACPEVAPAPAGAPPMALPGADSGAPSLEAQEQESIDRQLLELQQRQAALQDELRAREDELRRQQEQLRQQQAALRRQREAKAAAAAATVGSPPVGSPLGHLSSLAQSAPCNLAPQEVRAQMRMQRSSSSSSRDDPDSPTYAGRVGAFGTSLRLSGSHLDASIEATRGVPAPARNRRCDEHDNATFADLQASLAVDSGALSIVSTRAAGLKHIGFGPFKRENQDEFFIQVGHYGGQPGANLFCVFDGHGPHGRDAAAGSRKVLPVLLDAELKRFFVRNPDASHSDVAGSTRTAIEGLLTEVFGETEKGLHRLGINLANSGTTASVAYQLGNRLWVASAGDSRAILCSRARNGGLTARPLTLDHRPRRTSERARVEAAGARVQPKCMPGGRLVGEPRIWLRDAAAPGLLLSRSLGDLVAATIGCTSEPEVSYATLEPNVDLYVVVASDGVWDVLGNQQVCDIVADSPDPNVACRRLLDAALYEWEERMSSDNIAALVVELDWSWVVEDLPPGAASSPEAAMAAVATAIHQSGTHLSATSQLLPAIHEGPCSDVDDMSGDW